MDTPSELQGYICDCELCGKPIMVGDEHGELFRGRAHKSCIFEYDDDMRHLGDEHYGCND